MHTNHGCQEPGREAWTDRDIVRLALELMRPYKPVRVSQLFSAVSARMLEFWPFCVIRHIQQDRNQGKMVLGRILTVELKQIVHNSHTLALLTSSLTLHNIPIPLFSSIPSP